MKNITSLLLVFVCFAVTAKADHIVYRNGAINDMGPAWTINNGFSVSDSFTLSGTADLSSAETGLFVLAGDTPTLVDWAIGTSPFGSDISSGTASLTNTFFGADATGFFDIYESSFAINGSLIAGTYYFSLSNAVSAFGNPVYWNESNGPSSAEQTGIFGTYPIPSESFRLIGSGTARVPDSGSTFGLLTLSLGGVFGVSRLRSCLVA